MVTVAKMYLSGEHISYLFREVCHFAAIRKAIRCEVSLARLWREFRTAGLLKKVSFNFLQFGKPLISQTKKALNPEGFYFFSAAEGSRTPTPLGT